MSQQPQDPYPSQQPGSGSYAQPGYGPYPGYGYQGYGPYPVKPPTNTLAILALVFAFIFAPAAIIMGAIARKQIRRTGEDGMGLATAGLIIGIVFTALFALWIVLILVVFATAVHNMNNQYPPSNGAALFAAARAYCGF